MTPPVSLPGRSAILVVDDQPENLVVLRGTLGPMPTWSSASRRRRS